MTDRVSISTSGPIHGSIRPPGSKSITNRALVCAALASGKSRLSGALNSDDTQYMVKCLQDLGIATTFDESTRTIEVAGCGGVLPASSADLFVGNSGTTIRFVTAMCASGSGTYRLDGIERMRQRPIQDLLDALQALGVDATSESGTGCPPVLIKTLGLSGGTVEIAGDVSSQFLSGLLMAAPNAASDLTIEVRGTLVSRPYVDMTIAVMKSFGFQIQSTDSSFTAIYGERYRGCDYEIEPDASAASYFWAAAAITRGRVTVEGLDRDSLQGDVAFVDCLGKMGCHVSFDANTTTVDATGVTELRGIEIDMNPISDTVQTLAAVALFAEGPTTVTGIAHNRHKETDRIGDLATELRKFGAVVEEFEDGMKITPPTNLQPAKVETYDDHRMAMSLALVGLRQQGVVILNPGCTSKTYPEFFDDLSRLAN